MKYLFDDEKEQFNLFDSVFWAKCIRKNYLNDNDIDEILQAVKKTGSIDHFYLLKKFHNMKTIDNIPEQECMIFSPITHIIKICFNLSDSGSLENRLNKQSELLKLFLEKTSKSLYKNIPAVFISENKEIKERIKISNRTPLQKEIVWKINAEVRASLMIKNIDKELVKNNLIEKLTILNDNKVIYNKDILINSNIFFFFDKYDECKNCLELVKTMTNNEVEYQKTLLKLYALSFNGNLDGVMNLRNPLHSQRLDVWKFRKYIESQPFFKVENIYTYNGVVGKDVNFIEHLYKSFDYNTADSLIDKSEKNEEIERLKVFKPFYLINDIMFYCDYKEKVKKLKLLKKYILNEFHPQIFKSQFDLSLTEYIKKEYEKYPYNKKAEKNKNQLIELCTQSLIEREKIIIKENIDNTFSYDVKRNKRL